MADQARPETLREALAILSDGGRVAAAGCTDLFPATESQTLPGAVLDLTAVSGLRGISATARGWRIGATTTWTDVLRADLPPAFDMLKQAAREIGSVQIQNAGTVAGNLCNASPAADGVPPLLALEAEVEIASVNGARRLPLARFIAGPRRTALRPGELVTAVHVPMDTGKGRSRFLKLGARRYLVISIVSVAARVVETDGVAEALALAVGACSPVPLRLTEVERALAGRPVGELAEALDVGAVHAALSPIDDVRAEAAYRREAAVTLLRRALADLTGQGRR
ncbi:FAD binding domain-containing protein [Jhaorihella thermophila]|uniref:CO or xanthine dehydrogenase, FAD-binding subunit n=1 Tax=Jhaorihella thermophila TaxID=488547 RepID=A0A1H5T5D9_9RHOB|nr:FAD binding domain-containing protein [Jhaorihella thermophila]SEF57301.1 CO or xanthine dehydrogenase, FAD-binding subunit [Jhaorihella thermophila]